MMVVSWYGESGNREKGERGGQEKLLGLCWVPSCRRIGAEVESARIFWLLLVLHRASAKVVGG